MTVPMQTERCVPLHADFPEQIMAFVDECLSKVEPIVPARQANRLRIAVDEVSSNLLSYSGAATVTCHFEVQNSQIILTFLDDGTPYNPLTQDSPNTTASAEERTLGGLGLLLVQRLMSDVRYQYRDAQNILTLCLNLN